MCGWLGPATVARGLMVRPRGKGMAGRVVRSNTQKRAGAIGKSISVMHSGSSALPAVSAFQIHTDTHSTAAATHSRPEVMQTPHASKAAALESVASTELTTLAVNPKNGAKSVPFKRPVRVRLGGVTRSAALRCPFGPPKSFDPSKTDRVSFSVSVDPESAEATWANKLDEKARSLLKARLREFMEKATPAQIDENWKPITREAKSEEYWPTLSVKVQLTGARPTSIILQHPDGSKKATVEEINWTSARVSMICEARSVWLQPKMYGVSIEARQIWVWPGDEDEELPSEDDE